MTLCHEYEQQKVTVAYVVRFHIYKIVFVNLCVYIYHIDRY